MALIIQSQEQFSWAELKNTKIKLEDIQDVLDLMANAGYLGADRILIHTENLPDGFFDLKTRIAGEILQKFSN